MTTDSAAPTETAEDYRLAAQLAAEKHLDACYAELYGEIPEGSALPPESEQPFDGCRTCDVRETLISAYPWIRMDVMRDLRGVFLKIASGEVSTDVVGLPEEAADYLVSASDLMASILDEWLRQEREELDGQA